MSNKLGWFARDIVKPVFGRGAARTLDDAWDSYQEFRRTPFGGVVEEIVLDAALRRAAPRRMLNSLVTTKKM
jgi:hypothetical protein